MCHHVKEENIDFVPKHFFYYQYVREKTHTENQALISFGNPIEMRTEHFRFHTKSLATGNIVQKLAM